MVYCWMSSQIKTDGQRILLNNKNKNPIFPPYYYYYNLSYYILNFRADLENDGWNSDFEKKKKINTIHYAKLIFIQLYSCLVSISNF